MPVRFTKFAILRILLNHAPDLGVIIAAAQAIIEAEGWEDKFEGFTHLIDLLRPIINEILAEFGHDSTVLFGAEGDVSSLEAECKAAGFDWQTLLALLPQIMAAIKTILDLFTNMKVELEDAA